MTVTSFYLPVSEWARSKRTLDAVERWSAVATRTVYFGHQSVGDGIVAGVDALNGKHSLGLRLVRTREPSVISGPAFVDFHAGRNRSPASKNASMLEILDRRPHPDRPFVLLKYCYADVCQGTDVNALFEAYRVTVGKIKVRHPDATIVHSTVPLTTVETPGKAEIKRLLGRSTVRQDAIARQRYNSLVRAAYTGSEPVFDIARIESTNGDGSTASFMWREECIETLAPEYTRDGGHLNARGQEVVARGLLDTLAQLAESDS
jgi:hypothetical protein